MEKCAEDIFLKKVKARIMNITTNAEENRACLTALIDRKIRIILSLYIDHVHCLHDKFNNNKNEASLFIRKMTKR